MLRTAAAACGGLIEFITMQNRRGGGGGNGAMGEEARSNECGVHSHWWRRIENNVVHV